MEESQENSTSGEKSNEASDTEDDTKLLSKLSPASSELIPTPSEMDIICGRGKSVSHPGNQRFRQIIADRKEEYQLSRKRDDKTRITFEIVETLRSGPRPSRFLLRDPISNMWYDVGEMYAKEKVSHALRSRPTDDKLRRPKPKRRTIRKAHVSDEVEATVQRLIEDQQQLLKAMISRKEIFPGGPLSGF